MFAKLSKIFEPDSELVLDETKDKDLVAHQWEDSPLKEQAQNKPMYSLDQSCLKLLAYDLIERMAVKFAIPEAKAYGEAKLKLRQKINQKLYNQQKGLYLNRYADDTWAENYGATSFYPLIAGAIETPEQLRAVGITLHQKTILGRVYDHIIQTIRIHAPLKLSWENRITWTGAERSAYVNYLIYHG